MRSDLSTALVLACRINGDTKPETGNTTMLLTPQELTDLTGYQKPSAQMRWLTAQEIPFLVGGDGRPKVLRDTLTARLGSSLATGSRRPEPQLHLSGPRARKRR